MMHHGHKAVAPDCCHGCDRHRQTGRATDLHSRSGPSRGVAGVQNQLCLILMDDGFRPQHARSEWTVKAPLCPKTLPRRSGDLCGSLFLPRC